MATPLTREDITKLLLTNDRAVARALIVLNNNQTADEQVSESTSYHNGRGFRPCDAYMGTRMAKFYIRNNYLTPKQIAYWRRTNRNGDPRIAIYWRQLIEAAKVKQASVVSFDFGYNQKVAINAN
jgi:hypothetical protein